MKGKQASKDREREDGVCWRDGKRKRERREQEWVEDGGMGS